MADLPTFGDYRCLERLGAGGQATTWLAEPIDGGETVLLKIFHVEVAHDWKIAELFERSARVLEAIDHPNVPAYRDHFEVAEEGSIRLCLVREFVAGESLQEVIDAGGSLEESRVVELAIGLLETLEYLHQREPPIVHRDVKPANVIVAPDGRPILVDFGAVQADVLTETGGSTVVGTAGYVAPEQLMGRAQPSSDIYALGVTLVHLLTGIPPTNLPTRGFELDYSDVLDASPPLKYVLGRMTQADIDLRDATASGLLEKFRSLHAGEAIVVRSTTLPVRVPKGSELRVEELDDGTIEVRTPKALRWHSNPWSRRAGHLMFAGVAGTPLFFAALCALQSTVLLACVLAFALVILVWVWMSARPMTFRLGPSALTLSTPPSQVARNSQLEIDSGPTDVFTGNQLSVQYEDLESLDVVPARSVEASNTHRYWVLRLKCRQYRESSTLVMFDTVRVRSDTLLFDLGLSHGEQIWLARLVRARLEQHRELEGKPDSADIA